MNRAAQAFHIRELLVALDTVEGTAALALPGIINIDVAPPMIDEAGVEHPARTPQHFVSIHLRAPTIPTVPAHWRRQRDGLADHDAEFFLGSAFAVFDPKDHDVFAGFFQYAGDLASPGIKPKSIGQMSGREGQRPLAGGGDLIKKRMAGPHAEECRAVDARGSPRFWSAKFRRWSIGGVRCLRIYAGGSDCDRTAESKAPSSKFQAVFDIFHVIQRFLFGRSLDPEDGLRDGNVTAHLVVRWVRHKFFPKLQILLIAQGKTSEEEAWLPDGPAFPSLDIRLARPLRFVCKIRVEKFHRLADSASIRQLKGPEAILRRGEHLAKRCHVIELKDRIAVGFGALEFSRKTAVRGHLFGNKNLFELAAALSQPGLIASQTSKGGDLQPIRNGVIVPGASLFFPVLTGRHPLKVFTKPLFQPGERFRRGSPGPLHRRHRQRHL